MTPQRTKHLTEESNLLNGEAELVCVWPKKGLSHQWKSPFDTGYGDNFLQYDKNHSFAAGNNGILQQRTRFHAELLKCRYIT